MGITKVQKSYYLLMRGGMKDQNFLLIIPTILHSISVDSLGSRFLFTRRQIGLRVY